MPRSSRQRPHKRRSSRGKVFIAGKGKRKPKKRKMKNKCCPEISDRQRKQIFSEELDVITRDLKIKGKAKIPGLAIIKLKKKKGIKKGKLVYNPFTKEMVKSKGRPASKVIKFNAVKSLKEKVN